MDSIELEIAKNRGYIKDLRLKLRENEKSGYIMDLW